MSSSPQTRHDTRPRFSIGVWFYLIVFYLLLGFLPLILTSRVDGAIVPSGLWIASTVWPVIMAALWLYANRRCSSPQLRFNDSLLWIAASMMPGWFYLSFLFVLPILLFAFAFSVLVALYGDIRRSPDDAPTHWHRFVRFCYRNRMRQR